MAHEETLERVRVILDRLARGDGADFPPLPAHEHLTDPRKMDMREGCRSIAHLSLRL
jgi:hypothetical protein